MPADGPDQYRNVVVSVDLPDDRWITAIDFEPSARAVVHHALFFVGPASAVVGADDAVPGLGARLLRGAGAGQRGGAGGGLAATDEAWGGLGGWVPGMTPRFFPDGIAQPLPKHSNLVMQLHLHPSGKAQVEDGRLAIYFAKTPPEKSITGIQVPPLFGYAMGIDIPAGENRITRSTTRSSCRSTSRCSARAATRTISAREMKMTATLPDGSTKGLLWIKDWDFGWQDSYFYKTPLRAAEGHEGRRRRSSTTTRTATRATRTSPPQRVRWGRESFDEMGSMTLLVAAPTGADREALRAAEVQHFRQQLAGRLRRGGRE